MINKSLLSIALCLVASTAQAQFTGSSFFNAFPTSQLGGVTNNLTLTDTANGFVVTGQVIVNVPSTSSPIALTKRRPPLLKRTALAMRSARVIIPWADARGSDDMLNGRSTTRDGSA